MDVKEKAALNRMILEQQHVSYNFPDATNLKVVFTAHANAHTWSAWSEILDDGVPTTLSSKFAAQRGHISLVQIDNTNQKDEYYMIEIAYGTPKTIITPHRFKSGTAPNDPPIQEAKVRCAVIPAGEIIYYKMMCGVGGKTCDVSFRYHYH